MTKCSSTKRAIEPRQPLDPGALVAEEMLTRPLGRVTLWQPA
jgi:hypothetical protein